MNPIQLIYNDNKSNQTMNNEDFEVILLDLKETYLICILEIIVHEVSDLYTVHLYILIFI
jgi:translation elongation factor P/translation initiation factor 5A